MPRLAVESSVLSSVGYDPSARVLELEFTSGEVYLYFDVPERAYAELMAAESKGRFFNAHIRNRYPWLRLAT